MTQITVLLPVTVTYKPDAVKAIMKIKDLLPGAGNPRILLQGMIDSVDVRLEHVDIEQANQLIRMMEKDTQTQ